MSRLLRKAGAGGAASLGSFVLARGEASFRARPAGAAPDPDNDFEPQPITIEQEHLRREAQAHANGYDEARATVEAEYAAERDALTRLVEALHVLQPEPTNALALLLAETVDRLVRETVGEVEIDASRLLARAKAAAELIGENVEPSKLRANPEDLAILADAAFPIPLQGDPDLPRGTIVLETGHGWIEDGPAVRLERLRARLDAMAAQS
jgi:flagellar assembly protein FliH